MAPFPLVFGSGSTNLNLLLVVSATFALQIASHHIQAFAAILKTSLVPLSDCLMLLGLAFIPVAGIEAMKMVRSRSARRAAIR